MQPRISMIAAIGKNRELGYRNDLLWDIPDDLKRFKQLTLGHPCIMGRNTFDSIVSRIGKPLPGRANIVLSQEPRVGATVVESVEAALEKAAQLDHEEVFVIGGAQIYKLFLPHVDRLYLTLIDDSKEADVYFPAYEELFKTKVSEETHEHNGLKYSFATFEH